MSRTRIVLLVAICTAALGAMSGAAVASRGVDVRTGAALTAAGATTQTFTARVGIFTLRTSCTPSLGFGIVRALYSGTLAVVGSVSTMGFRCDNGTLGRVLNLPINLTATVANFSALTGTLSILGVQLELATPVGTCLFRGDIGLLITNGSTTVRLTGGGFAYVSGPCTSALTVGSATFNLNAPIDWTLLG
jgi:hypothetical protein